MSDEEPVYAVEKILKKRLEADGETEFYVKWVGYKKPTWEPRLNLEACVDLLEEFEKNDVSTPKRKGGATPKRKEISSPKKKETATPKKKVSTPKTKEASTPKKREASTPKKTESETPLTKISMPMSKATLSVRKTPKTSSRLKSTPQKTIGVPSTVMESSKRGTKRTLVEPTPAKPVVVSLFEEQETPSSSRSASPESDGNLAKRVKEGSPDIVKETKTEEVPKTGCSIM